MSKKFLGKVIAGAALGGASLLVFAPSAALADGAPYSDGHHRDALGRVFAKPHVVKPGHEVKLIEVCSEEQKHAWLWSKVTGKVDLTPKKHSYQDDDKKKSEHSNGWDDKKSDKGAESWKDSTEPKEYEGGDYRQEREYQEFLKYKEHQEYQEYRRYKEKKAPEKSASTEEKAAKPDASAGAVPAPSQDSRAEQPADGYQPPEASSGGIGGGLLADDAATNGWEDSKKADDHKAEDHKAWEDGKEADEYKAWQDSKKADEYKAWQDSKKADEYKAWQDSKKADDYKAEKENGGWEQKDAAKYEYWASVKIPWDAKPGTYDLKGSCGEGELIVVPKGWVDGGDGGNTASSGDNLAVGGVGMLGMAALGGLVLMRQRRTDESPA
ncbi:hypothetical protein [Plantactinospora sp. B24E8]|uniref:hypothetical protein n=1 Tax=Plantactinospora sp. B24E8 TaxID=3153567 RepID=UPI00325C9BC6